MGQMWYCNWKGFLPLVSTFHPYNGYTTQFVQLYIYVPHFTGIDYNSNVETLFRILPLHLWTWNIRKFVKSWSIRRTVMQAKNEHCNCNNEPLFSTKNNKIVDIEWRSSSRRRPCVFRLRLISILGEFRCTSVHPQGNISFVLQPLSGSLFTTSVL